MKLNSNKLKRSLLGLLAMTMLFSTSSAITVYADEDYNGDEGEGNGATASGYTFAACKPAQQGLRVTFLINTKTKEI